MKLIVGLGNPGREYERTRHNVGWWVVDHLADVWHLGAWRQDGQALAVSGRLGAAHVRLVKPLTFMNLSGAALVPYLGRPTFDAATDLLVVVDDVALPVGRMRLRAHGSAGGHNGLRASSTKSVTVSTHGSGSVCGPPIRSVPSADSRISCCRRSAPPTATWWCRSIRS